MSMMFDSNTSKSRSNQLTVKSTLGGDSPVDLHFYYDISSMYSYFAFTLLKRYTETLWKGRLNWHLHPVVIGFIFKATGNSAPGLRPVKGPYVARDSARMAAYLDVPLTFPKVFPMNSIYVLRILTAIKMKMPAELINVTLAFFEAYWGRGQDLSDRKLAEDCLKDALDDQTATTQILSIAESAEVKSKLKETTDKAIELGAFGVPTMFIPRIQIPQTCYNSKFETAPDGYEMFWGADRVFFVASSLGLPFVGAHPERARSLLTSAL